MKLLALHPPEQKNFAQQLPAAFLAVDVYLREICLDIVVECSVIKVAHFPLLYSNELVAGVDIAVRLHRNVVVAAAAAAQALYRAGTGVEVHHEVEEVELVLGAVRHDVAQLGRIRRIRGGDPPR